MRRPADESARAPLSPEQQALAEQYLALARGLARPMKLAWPIARDEFESAACLALVEAAESFDPARNVKFATFARHRILGALRDVQRNLILRGWRSGAARDRAPSVMRLTPTTEEKGRVLGSSVQPPIGSQLESIDAVEGLLRRLPQKHAVACREIYLHGRTQTEAASSLGLSQARLSHLHRESLDMLNGSWYVRHGGEPVAH